MLGLPMLGLPTHTCPTLAVPAHQSAFWGRHLNTASYQRSHRSLYMPGVYRFLLCLVYYLIEPEGTYEANVFPVHLGHVGLDFWIQLTPFSVWSNVRQVGIGMWVGTCSEGVLAFPRRVCIPHILRTKTFSPRSLARDFHRPPDELPGALWCPRTTRQREASRAKTEEEINKEINKDELSWLTPSRCFHKL